MYSKRAVLLEVKRKTPGWAAVISVAAWRRRMEKGERAPSWRQAGMEVSGDGQPHVREQAVGEE